MDTTNTDMPFLAQSARLLAAVVAAWIVIAFPAWLLAGGSGLEGSAWAAGLCLAAGWMVLAFVNRLEEHQRPVFGILLGTIVRVAVVLVGAVVVSLVRPELRVLEFFVWLGPFYIVTLVLETRWLLGGLSCAGGRTSVNPSDEVGVKLG